MFRSFGARQIFSHQSPLSAWVWENIDITCRKGMSPQGVANVNANIILDRFSQVVSYSTWWWHQGCVESTSARPWRRKNQPKKRGHYRSAGDWTRISACTPKTTSACAAHSVGGPPSRPSLHHEPRTGQWPSGKLHGRFFIFIFFKIIFYINIFLFS